MKNVLALGLAAALLGGPGYAAVPSIDSPAAERVAAYRRSKAHPMALAGEAWTKKQWWIFGAVVAAVAVVVAVAASNSGSDGGGGGGGGGY